MMIVLYIIGYLLIGFFSARLSWESADLRYHPIGDFLIIAIIIGWPFVIGATLGMVAAGKAGPAISWCARSPVFAIRRLKAWRTRKKLPVARVVKKVKS